MGFFSTTLYYLIFVSLKTIFPEPTNEINHIYKNELQFNPAEIIPKIVTNRGWNAAGKVFLDWFLPLSCLLSWEERQSNIIQIQK